MCTELIEQNLSRFLLSAQSQKEGAGKLRKVAESNGSRGVGRVYVFLKAMLRYAGFTSPTCGWGYISYLAGFKSRSVSFSLIKKFGK